MKLIDLNPRWAIDGEIVIGGRMVENFDRVGMGLTFDCPCCLRTARATRLTVFLANPIDGGPPSDDGWPLWMRSGETFENLTLTPSVDASQHAHWHGFIIGREIR